MRPSGKTELLEHERLIKLLPALLDLAVHQTIDNESVDGNCLAHCRRCTEPAVRQSGEVRNLLKP